MKIEKLLFVLYLFTCFTTFSQVNDQAPVIVATGSRDICIRPNKNIKVVKSVSITDEDSTTLDEVSIQISTNYDSENDILNLNGTHNNISSTWNEDQGQLLLEGPATLAEFEDAISDVYYASSIMSPTIKQFSIVLGNAFYLPATGHYYIFYESLNIRWNRARNAAAQSTFYGLEGYLATLTSAEEATFAGEQVTGTGWIGATDNAVEGEWRWATGPEAGTLFWQGNQNGTTVDGNFAFWNNGEPNDYPDANIDGQENFAHITAQNIGVENSWNDLPAGGTPGGDYAAMGYLVEYGGMPSDVPLQLSTTITFNVKCTVVSNKKLTLKTSAN